MCEFFSFITIPDKKKCLYFDWKQRKAMGLTTACDSHSHILKHYGVETDNFNAYEYNPLTKVFTVDAVNGEDDSKQAEEWVSSLDWKTIVEPLIIKPIIDPFALPPATVTEQDIELLNQWASVWDSVWDSVRASVGASVWDSVWDSVWASVRASVWDSAWDSVWASVWDSVWDSVRDSVRASVRAYISSFFDIQYHYDYSPAVKLWERGLVPSFDGKTWRLHTGKDAHIVYESDR